MAELAQQSLSFHSGRMVAGVDEAGRGPLAGPVVAAAVILDPDQRIDGLADSKVLSESRREHLYPQIRHHALAWSVAWSDRAEIDSLNILHATMLAMRRAIIGLKIAPDLVQIDGNRLPHLEFSGAWIPGEAVVGGDATIESISAASIIAKVTRDRIMRDLDEIYPDYGFARHKGYGTAEHRACIQRIGPCPQHRRSFRPVSEYANNAATA
jgi:ribonuclease HII